MNTTIIYGVSSTVGVIGAVVMYVEVWTRHRAAPRACLMTIRGHAVTSFDDCATVAALSYIVIPPSLTICLPWIHRNYAVPIGDHAEATPQARADRARDSISRELGVLP